MVRPGKVSRVRLRSAYPAPIRQQPEAALARVSCEPDFISRNPFGKLRQPDLSSHLRRPALDRSTGLQEPGPR
jgi:hypothetical protein